MTADPLETPQCTAMSKRSRERCRRRPIPGGKVCVMHGGAAPAVRAAAEMRRTQAEATALLEVVWNPDAAPVADPVEALAALAGKAQHALDVLGAQVTTQGLDGPAGVAWSRTMRELRQMLEGLERLGLEERRVRISEQAGQELASMVRRVLEQLDLSEQQWVTASQVVPAEFRALEAGTVVVGETVS